MTNSEYGRLQRWADDLALDITDNGIKGARHRWSVSLQNGKELAKDKRRTLALRKAKIAYDKQPPKSDK